MRKGHALQSTGAVKAELMKRLAALDPSSLSLIKHLETTARKTNDDKLLGYALYRYAYYYYFTVTDFDLFRKAVQRAIRYLLRSDDREYLASTYNLVAYDAQDHGCYDLAYAYFSLAERASEPLNGISLPGLVAASAGRLMLELGYTKDGRRQTRQAIKKLSPITTMHFYHYNMIVTHADDALASFLLRDKKGVEHAIRKIVTHYENANQDEKQLSMAYYYLPSIYHAVLSGNEDLVRGCFAKFYRCQKKLPEESGGGLIFEVENLCAALLERGFVREAGRLLKETAGLEHCENPTVAMRYLVMRHTYYVKTRNVKKQRESLLARHELQKKRDADQTRVQRYAMEFLDMTERIAKEHARAIREQEILVERAMTDALTGLPNRTAMNRQLADMFDNAKQNGLLFAIGMMDVDRFKRFNDTYGHQTGDDCLRGIGAVLKALIDEKRVFCARYGGDEFVICFTGLTRSEIRNTAGEISSAVKAIRLETAKQTVREPVCLSHGICFGVPGTEQKLWEYLSAADGALYRMKKRRAGRFCIVDAPVS